MKEPCAIDQGLGHTVSAYRIKRISVCFRLDSDNAHRHNAHIKRQKHTETLT